MEENKALSSKKITINLSSYNLPFVIDQNKIIAIIKNFLNRESIENVTFEFCLPISYSSLKSGDVIEIKKSNKNQKLLIREIIFYENFIKIYAQNYFEEIYNLNSFSILFKNFNEKTNSNFLSQIKKNSKTLLWVAQIPNLNRKNYNFHGFLGFFVGPIEKSKKWKGASIFSFQKNLLNSENFINETQSINIFGNIIQVQKKSNEKISPLLIDYDSELLISLSLPDKQKLFNINNDEFFSFRNLAKIGNEIISFKEAQEISNGIYKIKIFFRGLFGTESYINESKINQDFFLIDQNLLTEKIENQSIGYESSFKAITFGDNISSFSKKDLLLENLYSLQHTICNVNILKKNNENSKFKIIFEKRIRINESVFVSDFEENFETFESVIFEDFYNPNQIRKVDANQQNAFLIRIFRDSSRIGIISENVISDLFFEFNLSENLDEIYVEISSLNQIYKDYYFVSFNANLKDLKILNLEYKKNF